MDRIRRTFYVRIGWRAMGEGSLAEIGQHPAAVGVIGIVKYGGEERMNGLSRLLRRVVQAHPNLLAFGFGCALVLALFCAAEAFFRVKVRLSAGPGEVPIRSNFADLVESAPRVGYRLKPSSSLTERLTRGRETLYAAEYHTDANAYRSVPQTAGPEADCDAVFVGCSVTFGTGVEDDETLPARFAQLRKDYAPVNAGVPGYGVQQVWLQLSDEAFLATLPFGRGIAVYTFIGDHLNRLAGTPAVLSGWDRPLPWLVEEGETIEWRGTFADRDLLRYYLYRYGGRLHVYRFLANRFGRAVPESAPADRAVAFTVRVIEDAAKRLSTLRPEMELWVVLFPEWGMGETMAAPLRRASVKFLDYTRLLDGVTVSKDHLWYRDSPSGEWGHPKAIVHQMVAQQLAADLPRCTTAETR